MIFLKRLILPILATSLVTSSALAYQKPDSNNNRSYGMQTPSGQNEKDAFRIGIDIPKHDIPVPTHVQRDRFEISTVENQEQYKAISSGMSDREKIINSVFDLSLLMTPENRTIKPIDDIGITDTYITQVVFPQQMKINEALASFTAETFVFKENLLRFRPARGFATGNIVLTLTDGKRNYAMTLFVDKYFQKECRKIQNRYICRKDNRNRPIYESSLSNLSTIYNYSKPDLLTGLDAIYLYQKMAKDGLNIKENKEYVTFQKGGIYYKIIRDDVFGDIFYKNVRYKVTPRK